jgi:hypothetical protein
MAMKVMAGTLRLSALLLSALSLTAGWHFAR